MKFLRIAIMALWVAGSAFANPQFNNNQTIAGRTTDRWTFMTAWNLSSGAFQVSPNWFNGRSVWSHAASTHTQWIARFVYDQTSGQTRELAWYYSQIHVQ